MVTVAMHMSPEDLELLKKLKTVEDNLKNEFERNQGWDWHAAKLYPGTIQKLIMKGLVRDAYHSNSYHGYRIVDEAMAILNALGNEVVVKEQEEPKEIDANIFDDIFGFDDIKELISECIKLDKPVHILMIGPPGVAKTLFLYDIEHALKDECIFLLGSATSHAGLWDMVSERNPRILLIDEIEKMNGKDQSGLLSLMEGGRLARAKVGREMDETHNIWVFATCNRITGMSPELLDRFKRKEIRPYTSIEFINVVEQVLIKHESLSVEDAHEIAIRIIGKTNSIRDAVRIARLSKNIGVKRAIELIVE